jgi:diguanylate cyclase (GGDEF)-like protein/PAS domain S-box-containing protein
MRLTADDAFAILEASPTALICASRSGEILFANAAALELLDLTEAQPGNLDTHFLDWRALPDREFHLLTGPMARDGKPIEATLRDTERNGETLHLLALRAAADGQSVLERALEESEQAQRRLRYFIDMLPQAACIFDAEDRYLLWNTRYAELYPEIAPHLRIGIAFRDILRISIESGEMPEVTGDTEAWIEERMRKQALPVSQEEYQLRDGRWLRHDDRRTPDGGAIGMRIDISELKRREESFRLLFEANPAPMLLCDAATLRITAVNDVAATFYGYSRETLLRRRLTDLHVSDEIAKVTATLAVVEDACDGRTVWRHINAYGRELHVLMFVRVLIEAGERRLVVAVADVSDRIKAEAHITHLANHDPLTGLANRMYFRAALDAALAAHSTTENQDVVIHCLDLDGFKPVNDTYGHAAGDDILRMVAERLRKGTRSGDLVARLGGDEFAILQVAGPGEAEALARRIVDMLKKPFAVGDLEITIGCSAGVAMTASEAFDADHLMRAADEALYRAKTEGRNTWRFASEMPSPAPLKDRRTTQQAQSA